MDNNQNPYEQFLSGLNAFNRFAQMEYAYNPRELVFQHDKVKLYHYHAKTKNPHATPVLVVFATVNRPEILDLFPDKSFIGGLLANGLDVYFLDWGYPDKNDQQIGLTDYVTKYLHGCVNFITESTHKTKIDLIGVCQGGLICLSYAALYPSVERLVLISTPIDFQTEDNLIYQFLSRLDVDALINAFGNVPGAWLTQFFISLRPFELVGRKYLRFTDHLSDETWTDKFLRVEKWLHDAPDQTGQSFREFVKECYCANKLIKGELTIKNKKIDLQKLSLPILNVVAEEDEIIPPSSSLALQKYINPSYYTQKTYPSGHIGIYVSDKVNQRLPKEVAEWICADRLA